MNEIELEKLFVGKCNVRKDPGDISELIESIKQVGILEPLIVRPAPHDKYEVIVGNRRYNAAKKAGLKKVPCTIKEMTDEEAVATSLIENIQRGDIGEEEIVLAYNALHNVNPSKWTQAMFVKRIGKTPSWLSRLLTAYESFIKLRSSGLVSGMKAYPRDEERKAGVAPLNHLEEIEYAMKSDEVKKLPQTKIEEKRVELAKQVLDLPHDDAKRVIDRFKMYPEKPMQEIKEEALARKTGIALETYLPPRVARELDKVAEERKVSIEEILPTVVERGLRAQTEEREEGAGTLLEVEKPEVKPPYLTLEEPLSVQYHHQRIWNLNQLVGRDLSARGKDFHFDFVTVGYSQKSPDDLYASLKTAGVTLLVDVRKNPVSMHRPEFNRNIIEGDLSKHGIHYVSLPDLGIPRDIRDVAYKGDIAPTELFERYAKETLTKENLDKLENVVKGHRTFAILCTEVDPTMCHRHKIAEALTKRGKIGYDL